MENHFQWFWSIFKTLFLRLVIWVCMFSYEYMANSMLKKFMFFPVDAAWHCVCSYGTWSEDPVSRSIAKCRVSIGGSCFCFVLLATLHGMQDLSSVTGDPTRVPCSGSIESSALNSQGSPIWTIVFNQTLLVCIIILILYYSLGQFLFWYNFQLREKLQKQCKELLSTYDPVSRTAYILPPWLCHFFF